MICFGQHEKQDCLSKAALFYFLIEALTETALGGLAFQKSIFNKSLITGKIIRLHTSCPLGSSPNLIKLRNWPSMRGQLILSHTQKPPCSLLL